MQKAFQVTWQNFREEVIVVKVCGRRALHMQYMLS